MPRLSLSWLWQPLTIGKKQPPCKRLQQDKNDKCFFWGGFLGDSSNHKLPMRLYVIVFE